MGEVKVFTSENCAPCQDVARLIKQGHVNVAVRLIDIETDEGFEMFKEEVLSRGDGAVPTAYKDGKQCELRYRDGAVFIECDEDPQALYSPNVADASSSGAGSE